MNKCFFIGNLARDPEVKTLPSGVAAGNFTVAVERSYTNAEGKKDVDFFRVIVWRGLAELCGKNLKKGNKIAIFGSVQTSTYKDKNGEEKKTCEIIAEEIKFLTPKEKDNEEKAPDNQLPF